MPEQALYLKWRPLSFDDVVGQEHVTRTLRNSLKTGRIRHAYLFSGPRGTGKTTTARLLAKAVNCAHEDAGSRPCNDCSSCIAVNESRFLDLIEIDAASHTGVDDVRELRDKIAFTPGEGRYKVYIIDEVHRFSGNAFDALLKTLEEPPDHAIFVLATTEIEKVPPTIKSRCLQFEFRRVSLTEVSERLALIANHEGLQVETPAIELIARQGTGSVRDSISLLDQIVADPDEVITLDLAQRILGTANARAVKELVDALLNQDVPLGLHIINQAIDTGSDPRQFGQQVVEHLRAVLLAQTASANLVEASNEDRALYTQQAGLVSRSQLLKAIRVFNEAVNNYTGGWQPQLALELALIESSQLPEPDYVAAPPSPQQPMNQPITPSQHQKSSDYVPPEPTQPGEKPVIPVTEVRSNWLNIKKRAYQYNPNIPALMDHAHVRSVDGNRLVLGVTAGIFREKLSSTERIRIMEQAVFDVLETKLLIQVIQFDNDAPDADDNQLDDDILDDPLVETGLELGGQVKMDDD